MSTQRPRARTVTRWLPIEPETADFLGAILRRHRRLVAWAFAGSSVAALLEGSTLAILAVALQTLAGAEGGDMASEFGWLGAWTEAALASLGTRRLFPLLVIAAVATQLGRGAVRFGADAAAATLQARIEGDVRRRLVTRMFRTRFAEARERQVGDLVNLLDQVTFLGLAVQRLNTVLSQSLLLVVYLSVLLWLSWPATVVAAVAMLVASLSLSRVIRRVRTTSNRVKSALVRLSERTVEYLSGLRLVVSFGREGMAEEHLGREIDESVVARRQGLLWQAAVTPLIDSMAILGVGVFLLVGYWLLDDGDRAVMVRMATFVFVLYRLAPRLSVINKNWGLVNNYFPYADRIAAYLVGDHVAAPTGGRPFVELSDKIEFDQIDLRYGEASSPAIEELSFDLPRGSMVALVGPSGAGKSTLADLLLRLYDPSSGRILVDGVDLRQLDWASWREAIGVVSQETFLLHGTIHENIAFGRPAATTEEVEAAARAAHAHEFIRQLDAGYETLVGERGHRLSGGQRQRLAIARAVLRRPQVLILDEATSDLDSGSEELILQSLADLRAERTVLAIAHRLSTVAAADEILVLDGGRVVERGRHDELIGQGGTYSRLWALQAQTGGGGS